MNKVCISGIELEVPSVPKTEDEVILCADQITSELEVIHEQFGDIDAPCFDIVVEQISNQIH